MGELNSVWHPFLRVGITKKIALARAIFLKRARGYILTQSEFQSGRNRTVFCVLVVKLTTTKHFGILGLTRITKKNVRPHTSCMGGGGRRAPPPDARENHVIRWFAERGGDREGIGATVPESANHRITWFSPATGRGARLSPPPISKAMGRPIQSVSWEKDFWLFSQYHTVRSPSKSATLKLA